MKKLLNRLHTPTWLFILLLIVLVLRIPSFFEPYSYGDELIYLTLGEAVRQGIPLYKNIHDNKPPLLYITAALAGNLFWFKAILTFWMLITIFIFWNLTKVLFPKKQKFQKISTIIFALLTTLPLLEGNIVNAELFMIGPIMLAFIILLSKKQTPKNLILSGGLISIATLFKVPAAFDLGAIFFLWLLYLKKGKNSYKKIITNSSLIIAGFIAPILLTIAWYSLRGAFGEYLVAAFLQNVGYLSSFRPGDVQEPFLVKNGPLLFRTLIMFIGLLILYLKKKRLSKEFVFITAWLLFGLFAVTLSERPYPHYLIQTVPSISLLLGILFTHNKIEQVLAIFPLALAAFIPYYFNFWHYPTTTYYQRFVNLTLYNISKENYINSFGGHVQRNYDVANYITSSTKRREKVFVWGDGVAIYAMSKRLPPIKYVADYHIADFSSREETITALARQMPSFIIVQPNAPEFPALTKLLQNNYGMTENIDGAVIWKLLSPSVRSLLSS